jgi:prevent-host-death family protein
MTKLAASLVRDTFSDTLNRVAYRGERIVLCRRGKDLAAIVPIADLKLIQKLEDEIDLKEARKALAAAGRKGLRPIAYERVRERLGIK